MSCKWRGDGFERPAVFASELAFAQRETYLELLERKPLDITTVQELVGTPLRGSLLAFDVGGRPQALDGPAQRPAQQVRPRHDLRALWWLDDDERRERVRGEAGLVVEVSQRISNLAFELDGVERGLRIGHNAIVRPSGSRRPGGLRRADYSTRPHLRHMADAWPLMGRKPIARRGAVALLCSSRVSSFRP